MQIEAQIDTQRNDLPLAGGSQGRISTRAQTARSGRFVGVLPLATDTRSVYKPSTNRREARRTVLAARRLAQFRGAFIVFGVLTILMVFNALPAIQDVANGGRPPQEDMIVALLILGCWWGSIVVMWLIEEKRLRAMRRAAARRAARA